MNKEQIKEEIRICQALLMALDKPDKQTSYVRNEKEVLKKRKTLEEKIDVLKRQLKNLQ